MQTCYTLSLPCAGSLPGATSRHHLVGAAAYFMQEKQKVFMYVHGGRPKITTLKIKKASI
jgi:hypothetical protein